MHTRLTVDAEQQHTDGGDDCEDDGNNEKQHQHLCGNRRGGNQRTKTIQLLDLERGDDETRQTTATDGCRVAVFRVRIERAAGGLLGVLVEQLSVVVERFDSRRKQTGEAHCGCVRVFC